MSRERAAARVVETIGARWSRTRSTAYAFQVPAATFLQVHSAEAELLG